ncbi:hypothetical protein [Actinoplanes sp. NPDC051494]|uniref:hypothetical protein n=1 Tax=Actinoplanes sp. NPDC051494 TaxID=3363907 RepID=UPI003787AF4F
MLPYPHARQQAQQAAAGGDLPAARAILEQAVDQGRPGLATGDPELLATMRQLAGLHTRQGDPAGARRLLEEAYAAGQRVGPADPLMVLLAYDIAVVAEELANRHEARKNFALVARYGPAALGDDHPAVSHARDYADESATPAPADQHTFSPPVSGTPTSGLPAVSTPAPVLPAVSTPANAFPTPGPPVQGTPVSGTPVSGAPVSPSPFGDPGGQKKSRTPWVITSAAVVFAVVMLVVVLVRPGTQTTAATPVADDRVPDGATVTSAPDVPPGAASVSEQPGVAPSASVPAGPSAATSSSPAAATTSPAAKDPATTTPTRQATKTTAPPPATVTGIVSPKNGTGVGRRFNVTFSVSDADVAATGSRLALTVCVSEWCFLEGPLSVSNGRIADYEIPLGSKDGEGIGEKWTVRVDRLTNAGYDYLAKQKQDAANAGTWGNGVSTPMDKLNKKPVSSVTVTKTS